MCQILITTVIIILQKIIFIWPTYTYGLRRLVRQNQLIDMRGTSSLEDFILLMMFKRNLLIRKALKVNGPPD